MATTIVRCSLSNCSEPAAYKIAALWSDGSFNELKTFGFACSDHVGLVFRDADNRHLDYPTTPGETIDGIGIYKYEQGKRGRHLQRLWGLEENYRT